MDKSAAERIAQRFVGLPVEQRRQILAKMHETGQSFKLLPIAVTRHAAARIPLSYAQQRMLFLWQMEPGNAAYNVPMAVRLNGALDRQALSAALDRLVQRHETLRTRFVSEDGSFYQEILEQATVALEFASVAPADIEQQVRAELQKPFDLLSGTLLRVKLFQLSEREHVLTVCMHHVVSDGWSGEVLIREFVQLYQAQVSGQPAPLPELAVQYADYAIWQRAWLEAGEGERQLDYWKQQLGSEHPLLSLPLDHPRPLQPSHRGAMVRVDLPQQLSAQLKSLARNNGQTLFMVTLAALSVVLSRFSGQSDIRIGAPNAGRTRSELEGLIGFFINTQVLRVQVDEWQSFAELLDQVKQVVTGAQSHQELPFEHLVDALAPERNPGHNPLFQFKINQHVLAADGNGQRVSGLTVDEFPMDSSDARFDLAFDFTDTPDGIRGYFTYATDLFEAQSIERIADALRSVLQALVSDTDRRLADHPHAISSPVAEQTQDFACPDFLSLWQQGLRAGRGKTALRVGPQVLSFDELETHSNQFARYLHAQDIKPGMTVALCLDRSVEWVVSLLAVLKLGAVYLPLDSAQPAERLQQLVRDSGAVLLVHAPDDDKAARLGVCPVLAFDAALWAAVDSQTLDVRVLPGQAAYIIYTSGSTGQPKGVVISHGALANYVQGVLERLALNDGASMAMVSTVAADLGHTLLFGALASGRTLHLLSHEQAFDPDGFARYMAEHQVDVLKIVPSHLQGLLQAANPADVLPGQVLILGGEASAWALVEQVRALKPGCRVINHYGPTETTVGILTHEVAGPLSACRSVPVGQPLANGKARVLDAYLNPVAERVAGELYLGGRGLAQGYLGRAAMTAERFVPDPDANGQRLYRAGDRARWVDGVLEYLGRADDQVKIRGYRVEPGEVGQLLQTLDNVADAVVLAQPLESDETRLQLVAYCVAAAGASLNVESLRGQLAARLPEYLVPAQIMLLERLPVTANGKLDKRALPMPGVVKQRYTAPVGEIEEKLAAVWADVLKLEQVGSTDNFFELGGDSILSLQIIARAKRQGIKLSPKQLFEKQTIGQLASVAKLIQKKPAAVAEQISGSLPLLPIQARFFELDIPQRQHWNQALMLKPLQTLEASYLQAALTALVEQHDALRLGFTRQSGQWQATFGAPNTRELLWAHELDSIERLPELADEAQRSLDMKNGPLLRAVLINLPQGEQRLLLVIHHLVVDGVSWRVLLEDLQQAYIALAAGQPALLPAKTSSLQAWAEHLQAYAQSPALEQELSYWQTQLQDVSDALPCDHPHGGQQQQHALSVVTQLNSELTRQLLQDAPAAYRTQINDLLLTALARVVSRWTAQPHALIRLEGHGREDLFDALDLSRTVGWFSNVYPVRLTPQASLADSIMTIKEQLRGVPDKGIGYGALRYLGRESARQTLQALPLGSIVFNYLGQFDGSFDAPEALFTPSADSSGASQSADAPLAAPISINGQVYAGELRLSWTFSGAVFERETVQRLADEYAAELQQLIAHCTTEGVAGATPSDFPLARMSQLQLSSLPIAAGQIEDLYPLAPMQQGMLFHTLFEQQAGHYINQMRIDVSGLDVPRFCAAWQATLDAHEVLRSAFISHLQPALQVVLRDVRMPFVELDARGQSSDWIDQWADADRQQGFDLAQGPLLRLAVVRTGEQSHQLIYTSHHILMDGWSSSRLLGEVLQRYSGQTLPRQVSRYRDYIEWLQRQDAGLSERFWTGQLARLDEPTRLVQAFKAPDSGQGHGDYLHLIDAENTRQLSEFAREQRVTLNTLVQSAWLLVLQRYTGQSSVTFGATVAGRPADLPGVEEQLGLFINTLPVIASPRAEQRVAEWVQQVQAQNIALREHEHTPLYEIQRWARSAGEALFDTILVFENYPVSEALQQAAPPGLVFGGLHTQEQTHYPLTLVVNLGETLSLRFSYAREAFSEQHMAQLSAHFQQVLQALTHDAQAALGELALLSDREQQHVLREWNATAADFPSEQCLHNLIEAQVRATPDAPALIFAAEQMSYAQLNARANQLAHRLRESGVGPDVLVGICVERSLELVIGLLAIIKAGGAYVPLDPDYPEDRLVYMMQDSGIGLLLTQAALLERLPIPPQVQSLCLDQHGDWLEGYSTANPVNLSHPLNLAYVIYTSGSTGKPKGAGNSHRALVNRLHWMQKAYALDGSDTVLQKTPFSFDVSVWEFFWPLMTGARLAVALPGDHRDPERLVQTIREHKVTTLHFVPSMLQAFMTHPQVESCNTLRRVVCSGEALPAELAAQVLKRLPLAGLYNLYGPTEAAIDVTHWTCSTDDILSVPIGRPIDNLKTHILDDGLLPAAQVVAAELYLGGVGLARGYHNRAALTAERFVPDPFDEQGGGRLYRTGDLARYRDAGVIDYAGRIDHQVKIRGLRIELGEIEARLHEHAAVREATVIDIDGPSGKQLVAYLVPTDAAEAPDVLRERLQAHLKAHVPDYMVPGYFVFIDSMPLTANGKLDRRALPKPDVARSQQGYVAPRTAFEQRLAALWEQVLHVERVGLNDNFFALGGHSLLAVSLVGRIRETFDISIKLHDLLLLQTLGELADFMRADEARVKSAVIAMNANGSTHAPLFCLPPGGGGTYSYYPLAGRLSDSRRVYGLVNKAYVVPGWFDTSWQDMVDYYVEQIRMTQPHGPYNLLGWSMGGALAVEVAHVLERAGEVVSFLGLVDTQLPASVGMQWVEEDPQVTTQQQGENYYRSLIKSLQAFVPGLQEQTIVDLIEKARQSVSGESEVIDQVIEQIALQHAMNVDSLRSMFQDIAVQDEIETGYKLLEANAKLSQAFTLKTLNVQVDCWWAGQSRKPGQIAKAEAVLLEQCSVNGLRSSTTIDQRHGNLVIAEAFLQGLAERLV
ncbi:amino acid adenylation domain-containing protein [Pseudomonas syringae pv. syringae]|uniref:non-ribosomal peptide synthetase n=1 Tax=Pseudomonas syringae TaxID=317 RepID=UPI001F0EF64D|nr:non-ribosomal peptide synthetase [Pseudomonas syringae]MCH5532433.1 amino acid adenylation domain-containing protein [Pseudomonas syringae pv. syringae]MCH5542405.1 amino acid adenylation domain-containing protein [Pseudomonas syringae pv. syringae]MCH5547374.1 amino acid adenylation domain-containing protein [Pseudomonas syringae pv. syringae]MCH5605761.1 amino acid adenylation domain-containing protein [Pseudomonas syringae pv. syringae]MCH5650450.1 amino acid adenylation domain-containin